MKKSKILFITCLLFLIASLGCNRANEKRVRIESNKEFGFLLLDSVFSKIRFVPLETKVESLIASISKLEKLNNRYVIYDRRQELLFLFSENGSFIRQIGRIGKSESARLLDMFSSLKKTDWPNPVIIELTSI